MKSSVAEFREPVKWFMFLSSYIPLYPILAIKHWPIKLSIPQTELPIIGYSVNSLPVVSIVWIILALISALVLLGAQNLLRLREQNDDIRVESYRSRNDLITTYILVYIFPFVVLNFNSPINWLIFLTFFFVVGILQVRSNQLHVNPILALLRYDIYEVNNGTQELILVTREGIDPESEIIETTKMTNGVYIVP